jgi:CheY-like chemotaxis protein
MMRTLVDNMGWDYDLAENGKEAVEKADRKDFDLLLLDIQMPEMDGFEVTRYIREKEKGTDKHLPIIAVTAFYMKGYERLCKIEGMDGYLPKPINVEKLYSMIDQLT